MTHALAIFLYYFTPISAGMFVFGLINAIKYVIQGNSEKVTFYGFISTVGLLILFRTLLELIAW